MPRLDLHVHSSASFDCRVPPLQVARRCRALGLDPTVLTDHDTIAGALELKQAGLNVIVGQEVTTTQGELIGLFLTDPIPSGLTPDRAVQRIHRQGGLVYLEHPYDSRRRRLREEAVERLADEIDVVEVWNGRSDAEANRQAEDLCLTLGAAPAAGSDAHTLPEIGRAYVELGDFEGAADFLRKLREARVVIEPSRLRMRAQALFKGRKYHTPQGPS